MRSHLQQCITQFSYIWYIKCNPNYYITPKRKPSVLPEYWFSSWNVLSANPTLQVLMRVVLDLPSLDGKMVSCWIHHLVEVMYQPNPQFCQVSIQWTWLMCLCCLWSKNPTALLYQGAMKYCIVSKVVLAMPWLVGSAFFTALEYT